MIVYGKKIFLYLLQKHQNLIQEVLLSKECDKKLFLQIAKLGVKISKIDNKKAQAIAKGGNHQGFFAKILPKPLLKLEDIKHKNFILLLDNVTDMGNIGSICRSAYIFGVDAIIITEIKDLKMSNIIRTSSGAALELDIVNHHDTNTIINELKQSGFSIYATSMNGKNLEKISFANKKVIILGNEEVGIPNKTLKLCDEEVKINMIKDFDSLNVSVVAGILCNAIANA